MEKRKHVFVALDALRGVAAMSVVMRHFGSLFGFFPQMSYLAVDLFFILSGFVISYSYEHRLLNKFRVSDFMVNRFIRLWPLYFAGSAGGVLVRVLASMLHMAPPLTPYALLVSAVFGAFMLPVFLPSASVDGAHLFPFNFPAWSLFWELVVNFVYAAAIRRITLAALGIIVATSAVLLVLYAASSGSIDHGSLVSDGFGGWPRVMFGFFAGVALHVLWRKVRPRQWLPAWVVVMMFVGVISVPVSNKIAELVVSIVLVLFVFPMLVWLAVCAKVGDRMSPIYRAAGIASYPIYTLHGALIVPAKRLIPLSMTPWSGVALLAVLLCVGLIADKYYDRPVRKLLGKLAESKEKELRARAA